MADTTHAKSPPWQNIIKLLVLGATAFVIYFAYTHYADALSLSELAKHERVLRNYQESNPWLLMLGAFLLYVLVSGLSIPGGPVALSLFYGWYFGWGTALVLVSFASTAGATIAFLMSRYLFRDWVQQNFGDRLTVVNQKLATEGAFYLFSMRLIPAVPFFLLNLLMGLTPMKTKTFWWVSQIGMLAGTMVFIYAGSSVPTLQVLAEKGAGEIFSKELLAAFVLLGTFPIAVKMLMERYVSRGRNASV